MVESQQFGVENKKLFKMVANKIRWNRNEGMQEKQEFKVQLLKCELICGALLVVALLNLSLKFNICDLVFVVDKLRLHWADQTKYGVQVRGELTMMSIL